MLRSQSGGSTGAPVVELPLLESVVEPLVDPPELEPSPVVEPLPVPVLASVVSVPTVPVSATEVVPSVVLVLVPVVITALQRVAGGADEVPRAQEGRHAALGEHRRAAADLGLVARGEGDDVDEGALREVAAGLEGDLVDDLRDQVVRAGEETGRDPVGAADVVELAPGVAETVRVGAEAEPAEHLDEELDAEVRGRVRAAGAVGHRARRGVGEEHRHPARRRRTAEEDRRQVGEDLLVPAAVDRRQQRIAAAGEHAADHGPARLLPDPEVGLEVVGDLVEEDRLPRVVAVPGDPHDREGVGLAEEAVELDAAPHGRGRVAVLHVADRLEQGPGEDPRRGVPDRLVAVGGDHVVGGERGREGRAALGEDLEEEAEGAARPVDLTLDQGDVHEEDLARGRGPGALQVGEPA